MTSKLLTKPLRLCLEYYRDNETNPNRVGVEPCGWTMRSADKALDNDWLKVGPGGWHVLTEAGRAALKETGK